MTDAPKPTVKNVTEGKTLEIIELVDVTDWRFVAVALVVGIIVTVVVLSLIEHTDDKSPFDFNANA